MRDRKWVWHTSARLKSFWQPQYATEVGLLPQCTTQVGLTPPMRDSSPAGHSQFWSGLADKRQFWSGWPDQSDWIGLRPSYCEFFLKLNSGINILVDFILVLYWSE